MTEASARNASEARTAVTYTTYYLSPVGRIMLASDGESLIGLWIEGQKYFGDGVLAAVTEKPNLPVFEVTRDWLDRYFAKEHPDIAELPLNPRGSAFRQAVWTVLREIPYGETTTYGEIARIVSARLDRTNMSSRAVGGAVGQNPISIIIPCHRVVGADGSLTGYSGGIDKKVKLLRHEGVDLAQLYVPTKGTAL